MVLNNHIKINDGDGMVEMILIKDYSAEEKAEGVVALDVLMLRTSISMMVFIKHFVKNQILK